MRLIALFQLLEFGAMAWIDLSVRDVPTVIVDQDHTEESRRLVELILATQTFRRTYTTSSAEQARAHIRAGRAKAAIVIPPDYGRTMSSGGTARILAMVDGSDSAMSDGAADAISGLAAHLNLEAGHERVAPRVEPRALVLFNPQRATASFTLPALLMMLLADTFSGLSLMAIISERDGGNLERLLMTPLRLSALLFGKLVPAFVFAFVNGVLWLLVFRFGMGIPIRGSLPLLLFALLLHVVCCVLVGAFVAVGAKGVLDGQTKLWYFQFPAMWLSGLFFPLTSLPNYLLPYAYALPQTHSVEIMRGVCLRGATTSDLALHFAFLIVFSVFLGVASVRKFSTTIMQ